MKTCVKLIMSDHRGSDSVQSSRLNPIAIARDCEWNLESLDSEATPGVREFKGGDSKLRNETEISEWPHADLLAVIGAAELNAIVLDSSLRVRLFTPCAGDALGLTAADVGRPLAAIAGCWEDDSLIDAAKSVIEDSRTIEREIRTREGDRRSLKLAPLQLQANREESAGRGVMLMFVENAPRREHVEADREADRRRNEFFARLGHELRNPLAAIKMSVMLLESDQASEAKRRSAMPILANQLAHMQRLTDDLLDISRIALGWMEMNPQRVALQRTIQDAVESSSLALETKFCEIQVSMPDEPLWLDGDPVRLRELFENLISNAVRGSEIQGRIEIAVGRCGDEASVRVRDYGEGVPLDELPRLFDPFERSRRTLDRSNGGLELGLSLTRRLAEMHGGRVEAFSEGEGRGSEFVVSLPLIGERKRL